MTDIVPKEFSREVKDFSIGIVGYYDNVISPSEIGRVPEGRLVTLEGIVVGMEEITKHVLVRAVKYYYMENNELMVHEELAKQDYLSEEKIYNKFCMYCKKRPAHVDFSDEDSVTTFRQIAWIQDKPEKMKEGKTVSQPLRVILLRDYVDMLSPGDIVKLTGFWRTRKLEDGAKSDEIIYFVVLGIEYEQTLYSNITLTADDLRKIEELRKNPKKLMKDFIDSVAPGVKGFEKIKEAIALQLVGGQDANPENRGNIHLLIIGEPGTGKTKLLMEVRKIAPKPIYVTGETSTKAGLSVAVTRDEKSGKWQIEAGALALGNGGFVLLDEIDKLKGEDIVSLREAMEWQFITLTKVKKANLSAKVSIIAAGNPKGNKFRNGNIFQYVDIDLSILQRFDLIFTVQKHVDTDTIRFIYESTLPKRKTGLSQFMYNPPIEPEFLKKIIIYARTYLFPKWTDEAENEVIEAAAFLSSLAERIPELNDLLSNRLLKSLSRLAVAYAKLQLKDFVEVEDVRKAFDMLMESISSLGFGKLEEGEEES